MSQKILNATLAFNILINVTANVLDNRKAGEEMGVIDPSATDNEAISYLVATKMVTENYDSEFSPQIMFSLLKNYCIDEISENFLVFYKAILQIKFGQKISDQDITESMITPLIDISDFAEYGKKNLGYKKHYSYSFKEPHKSEWVKKF